MIMQQHEAAEGRGLPHSPARIARKQPHLLTGAEDMILRRIQRIDRGEGCHATVERIGLSVDDKRVSFSISQTRRHLRRLRELGHIHFAGQTAGGRNVYVLPEREYVAAKVPVCASRPIDHLQQLPTTGSTWSTERASAILRLAEGHDATGKITVIDGYPVNKHILTSYGDTTLRRAIAALKQAYPDPGKINNRSRLLRYFLSLQVQDDKKRRDATLAEQRSRPRPAGPPPQEAAQVWALIREGRTEEAQALARSLEKEQDNAPQAPTSTPAAEQPRPDPAVSTVLARYCDSKDGGKGPQAFHAQKADQLGRLLGPFLISELTKAELILYQRKRRSEGVQNTTIKAELKVLRQAMCYAVTIELIEADAVSRLWATAARGDPPDPEARCGP